MKTQISFAHLDEQTRAGCSAIIEELAQGLERRLLKRFKPDLVKLDARVEGARGKGPARASLRLQLPSGVLAAHEEGREPAQLVRESFSEIEAQLTRHLARLRREHLWKRPARRARIGALLPPAQDEAESSRRALYFDLIEDHLDAVYNHVRRELTYLECSGAVAPGALSVHELVDAVILKGLERFDARPDEFSVGDWLIKLAIETIEAESRAARRAIPADAASLEREAPTPNEEPTAKDQEMFEFYQPDDVLLLEDIVADDAEEDAGAQSDRREMRLALHRAIADLPTRWRNVVVCLDVNDMTLEQAAKILDLAEDEVERIAAAAREFLRRRLIEAGHVPDEGAAGTERAGLAGDLSRISRIPMPLEDRDRLAGAMSSAG